IDASTGEVVTTAELDFESSSSHTLTVRAVDPDGLSIERDLTVTVGDVNESPVGLGFVGGSVDENAPAGTSVATASATDPDAGDTLTYSLVDDADGAFAIDASTGEVVTTAELDHESASSHTLTVRAVDPDGLSIERDLTVTVGDVNESPVLSGASAISVVQSEPVTLALDVDDPDAGDAISIRWSQTAGPAVELDGVDTASPSFMAPNLESETELRFVAVVDDGTERVEREFVVTVAPGDAGRDRVEAERASVEAAGQPLEVGEAGQAAGEDAVQQSEPIGGAGDAESFDPSVDPAVTLDTMGADGVTPPVESVPETIEWITGEIHELAEIAASIQPADLERVMPEPEAGRDATFADVFVDSNGKQDAYESGRAAEEAAGEKSSDTFLGRFVALMRAGFGIHQRTDDEESGDLRDKFKR
ncbi:MAG: cadherin domain-containing protein, partial [Planctomycetota bacterium]